MSTLNSYIRENKVFYTGWSLSAMGTCFGNKKKAGAAPVIPTDLYNPELIK